MSGFVVALAGFAVLGYGTSVLVPLIFSTVGHSPEGRRSIDTTTTGRACGHH